MRIEPSEVQRDVVNPGQACSHIIGQMKILELRERIKREQGDCFSLQQFHKLALATGTMLLELLESRVDSALAPGR